MTTTTTFDPASVLPDALLERFRERAAQHDSDNTFPHDDLADLTDAGYLALFAPTEIGGAGLGLAEVSLLQQRLATAAPATALRWCLGSSGLMGLARERQSAWACGIASLEC